MNSTNQENEKIPQIEEKVSVTGYTAADAPLTESLILLAQDLVLMGDVDLLAAKYEITPKYINNLLRTNDKFKEVVEEFCDVVMGEVKTSLVSNAKQALDIVTDIMKDKTVDVQYRLRAAQDVLNRAGAVAAKDEKKQDTVVNVVFSPEMLGVKQYEPVDNPVHTVDNVEYDVSDEE